MKQTTDHAQKGPGTKVTGLKPRETSASKLSGFPKSTDGQSAVVKENRNKRS